ncbi:hypothetical protein [Methylobacterium frigidaeris]|uniref:hypothetical protein n=1 Tax=Methylobacterium frigidaeris TaxID=2038277 RepID=UPI000C196BC4|nr:hypothetical protein [Methylobacterium frigidaeris]PIK72887.1 hypothetical protein CS379_11490 [Methylobacterium frigidaeris]
MVEQQNTSTFSRNFYRDEPAYRAYLVDGNGKIIWAELIPAHDDKDAMSLIRAMIENHAIELWDRARFITRLEVSKGLCAV